MNMLNPIEHRSLIIGLLAAGLTGVLPLAAEEYQEELQKTYPLAADGRLELGNVNGTVRITAWDRDEVKLQAVKRAKVKEQLDRVKIEIDAGPDRLRIRTRHPDSKGWRRQDSVSVDYTLSVPRSAQLDTVNTVNGDVVIEGVKGKVEVSTVNGGLKARGLAGTAKFSTVNGGIKASFDHLEGVESVSVSTVNGGAELELPAGANADLSASSVNGGISGDVEVKKNWPIGREVQARLGQGGTKIRVSSVNGGLTFRIPQAAEKN